MVKSLHEEIISSPEKLAREIHEDVMAGEDEIAEAIDQAIRYERNECAKIAATYGGRDAEQIAEEIGKRNFKG